MAPKKSPQERVRELVLMYGAHFAVRGDTILCTPCGVAFKIGDDCRQRVGKHCASAGHVRSSSGHQTLDSLFARCVAPGAPGAPPIQDEQPAEDEPPMEEFEKEPRAAVRMFWEASGVNVLNPLNPNECDMSPIGEADRARMIGNFNRSVNLAVDVCCCCGERPISEPKYVALADMQSLLCSDDGFARPRYHYVNEGLTYHVVPAGLHHDDAGVSGKLCEKCHESVRKKEKPPLSLAGGWSFIRKDLIPTLTVVERIACCRFVPFCTIIKITGGRKSPMIVDDYSVEFSGHVISFPSATQTLAAVLPRSASQMRETLSVVFVGNEKDSKRLRSRHVYPQLAVRASAVLAALTFYKEHNPMYQDLQIDSSPQLLADLEALPAQLVHESGVSMPDTIALEYAATSNVAAEVERVSVGLEDVFVTNVAPTIRDAAQEMLRHIRAPVVMADDGPSDEDDEEPQIPHEPVIQKPATTNREGHNDIRCEAAVALVSANENPNPAAIMGADVVDDAEPRNPNPEPIRFRKQRQQTHHAGNIDMQRFRGLVNPDNRCSYNAAAVALASADGGLNPVAIVRAALAQHIGNGFQFDGDIADRIVELAHVAGIQPPSLGALVFSEEDRDSELEGEFEGPAETHPIAFFTTAVVPDVPANVGILSCIVFHSAGGCGHFFSALPAANGNWHIVNDAHQYTRRIDEICCGETVVCGVVIRRVRRLIDHGGGPFAPVVLVDTPPPVVSMPAMPAAPAIIQPPMCAPRSVTIGVQSDPVNEFAQNRELLFAGFPDVFTGVAWDSVTKTPLTPAIVARLIGFFDGRFENNAQLAFYLFDERQRHMASQRVAARVKAKKKDAQQFADLVNDPDFQRLVEVALKNPEGREANVARAKVIKFLVINGSHLPFSPIRRRALLSNMMGEIFYRGLPFLYFTLSPADIDLPAVFRLSDGIRNVNLPLPSLNLRTQTVKNNPCAAARVFHRLIEAVATDLVCLGGKGSDAKKTTSNTRKGCLGKSVAMLGVYECQGRMALHMHALIWATASPDLVSRIADDHHLSELLAIALDEMICSELPQECFRPRLEKYRGATVTCPTEGSEYADHMLACAASCQVHRPHSFTCWKKNQQHCRMARPQPIKSETSIATILVKPRGGFQFSHLEDLPGGDVEKPFDLMRSNEIRPLVYAGGIAKADRRLLCLETSRPKLDDGYVAEFSPVILAATGSNNNVVAMGSWRQCRNIVHYLLSYLTKDSAPLKCAISCLVEAQSQMQRYSYATENAGHLLTLKLINRITSKCEFTPQMVFTTLINESAEYTTSVYSYLFVRGAIRYARGVQDDEEVDSTDSDEEGGIVASRTLTRNAEGLVELGSPQFINYAFRGLALDGMTLYEYSACVVVVRAAGPELNRGRKRNATFQFDDGHPLKKTHVQRLRSQQAVPVLCDGKPPTEPLLVAGEAPSRRERDRQGKVAEYVRTVCFPWNHRNRLNLRWSFESVVEDVDRDRESTNTVRRARALLASRLAMGLQDDGVGGKLLSTWRFSCADERRPEDTVAVAREAEVSPEALERLLGQVEMQQHEGGDARAAIFLETTEELLAAVRPDVEQEMGDKHSAEARKLTQGDIGEARRSSKRMIDREKERVDETAAAHHHQSNALNPFSGVDCETSETIETPSTLNAEQRECFAQICNAVLQAPSLDRPVIALLGGPGCGKSFLVNAIARGLRGGYRLASTGVASTLVEDAQTVHRGLRLGRGKKLTPLSLQELARFQGIFRDVKYVIIDECSMTSREVLTMVNARLQQICPRTLGGEPLPFGGLQIVLVGDMYQLPCVMGTNLYSSKGGDQLPVPLRMLRLRGQVRAAGDPDHAAVLEGLRNPSTQKESMRRFLERVKYLDASERDERFRYAPIIVASNLERRCINRFQIRAWAGHFRVPTLLIDLAAGPVNGDDPESYFLFAPGAPAMVLENIAPRTKKIANGTIVSLVSLVYDRDTVPHYQNGYYVVPAPQLVNVMLASGEIVSLPVASLGEERSEMGNRVVRFPLSLGFSYTFHKVQGATLDACVLDLSRRPRSLGKMQLAAVYVAISRVRTLDDIRMFPPRDGGLGHLVNLTWDKDLLEWLQAHEG